MHIRVETSTAELDHLGLEPEALELELTAQAEQLMKRAGLAPRNAVQVEVVVIPSAAEFAAALRR